MGTFRGTEGADRRDAYTSGERAQANDYYGLGGNDSPFGGDLADTLDGDSRFRHVGSSDP